jgi:predicted nucleotidyltransferase
VHVDWALKAERDMSVLTEIRPELGVDDEAIAAFCQEHGIRWLAVFGSVLRDDFRPESDIDVLIEFEPGAHPGFEFFGLPDEMSLLFGGHEVDLITKDTLNRWIRGRVLREAQVLYDAA